MIRLRRTILWTVLLPLLAFLPLGSGPYAGRAAAPEEKTAGTKADAKKPANEGTWMNVEVSPDGGTILFDLLGDIYRVGIAGGKAGRVTSGPAYDYAPRCTPDGLCVLARREETSKAGIPPVEIWMYHRDGGTGVKVIPKDKLDTSAGPVASPDGRYVYLTGRKANTGLEHSLPVHLYKDVVTLAARSGTTYTPTLIVSYGGPTAEYYWYQHANPHDDARLRRFTPHEMLDALGRRRVWYPEEDFHFPTVATARRASRAPGAACRWAPTASSRVSARTGRCGPSRSATP